MKEEKKTHKKDRAPLPLPDATIVRSGKAEEEGVTLLLYRIETPAFDAALGKTEAASFYEAVASSVESFLTERLSASLRAAYLSADPARRRFTFRPAIYLHAATAFPGDAAITVERTVTLKRAGRLLFSSVERDRWNPLDGSPLPPPEDAAPKKRAKIEKGCKKSEKKVDSGAGDML